MTDARWLKLWMGAVLVTVLVHSTTLVLSPVYWLDEAQILDWGRSLVFEPDTTWSVSWLPEGRPAANYGYLGPALQEMVFRLSGLEPWAPRLASVLGGVAAATMLLAWLWARGLGARASVLGGALLLVDPTLVQACRGGRVDGWAIAVALGAAWALHRARTLRGHSIAFASLSGALAATAPFIWPTALAGLTALALELVQLGRSRGVPWPGRIRVVAAFVATGAVTGVLLGGVYIGLHGNPLSHVRDALGMQFTSGAGYAQTPVQMVNAVIEAVVRSPGVWLLALLGTLVSAARPLAAAGAVALVVLAPSYLYVFRILYLFPLLAAAAAAMYAGREQLITQGRHRLAAIAGPILMVSLAWSAFISLGARQAVAWSERHDRDPGVVYEIARHIGPGDHAVFVWAEQFYYPGRQLGWRMFRPFRRDGAEHLPDLLARMDFAITGFEFDHTAMTAAGLVLVEEATPSARYGPYRLYRRATAVPPGQH